MAYFSVNFVMLSLILAVVYNAYAEALKESVLASFRNRALGLRAAYQVRVARTPPDAIQCADVIQYAIQVCPPLSRRPWSRRRPSRGRSQRCLASPPQS